MHVKRKKNLFISSFTLSAYTVYHNFLRFPSLNSQTLTSFSVPLSKDQKGLMDYFKFLPVEITLHILTRVPTESALQCKSVSKTWRNFIGHPSFSKMHFNHHNQADNDSGELSFFALTYKIELVSGKYELGIPRYHYFVEYNEKHESTPIERIRRIHSTVPFNCFVGSLNGLICLVGNPTEEQPHEPIYIFNPVIKEYVMLPEINTNYSYDVFWTSGFGYVSATNEYKVVKIYISKTKVVKVCIYTLGSGNGWRNLGDFNPSFAPSPWAQGVFANGALHWMGVELDMIVTFNLAEEKFCQHLSPPPSSPDDWPFNRIGVLDGFWFFDNFLTIEEDPYYDIWLSKRKNDDHDMKVGEKHLSPGWSKEFRVDDNELLAVTKSGVVLTYTDNSLNIYNTKASTSKRLVEFKERIRTVFPHKNTLVSLKELGEEGTKIMEFIEIEETESLDQPLKQQ